MAPAAPLLISVSVRANAGLRSSIGLVLLTGAGLADAAVVNPKTNGVTVKPLIGQPPCFQKGNCWPDGIVPMQRNDIAVIIALKSAATMWRVPPSYKLAPPYILSCPPFLPGGLR